VLFDVDGVSRLARAFHAPYDDTDYVHMNGISLCLWKHNQYHLFMYTRHVVLINENLTQYDVISKPAIFVCFVNFAMISFKLINRLKIQCRYHASTVVVIVTD
jgi:hypothetical protein